MTSVRKQYDLQGTKLQPWKTGLRVCYGMSHMFAGQFLNGLIVRTSPYHKRCGCFNCDLSHIG